MVNTLTYRFQTVFAFSHICLEFLEKHFIQQGSVYVEGENKTSGWMALPAF